MFFSNSATNFGLASAMMAEGAGMLEETSGGLGHVRQAIARCETAMIFAKGEERDAFEAILGEVREAKRKLVGEESDGEGEEGGE